MNRELRLRAREIFGEAEELPDAERDDYLNRICENDGPLREEVEPLLGAHAAAARFLERS